MIRGDVESVNGQNQFGATDQNILIGFSGIRQLP